MPPPINISIIVQPESKCLVTVGRKYLITAETRNPSRPVDAYRCILIGGLAKRRDWMIRLSLSTRWRALFMIHGDGVILPLYSVWSIMRFNASHGCKPLLIICSSCSSAPMASSRPLPGSHLTWHPCRHMTQVNFQLAFSRVQV